MLCLTMLNNWDQARDAMDRLRESDFKMSRALVEHFVRFIHRGSNDVDDYVAIICKLWDETQSADSSP
jgi:hypothetical protein